MQENTFANVLGYIRSLASCLSPHSLIVIDLHYECSMFLFCALWRSFLPEMSTILQYGSGGPHCKKGYNMFPPNSLLMPYIVSIGY